MSCVTAAVIVGLGCAELQHWLARHGVEASVRLLFSDGVAGIFAGVCFWQWRMRRRENRALQNRLSNIAEVNQHVRNALAVVAFYGSYVGNQYATVVVQKAIERLS